ncbi:hypothetical protein Dda_8813 [Drechslerella dactyloides]|uniref:Uncharacterized protein n=1 Tax=Drechslerella dactyloides TaxID=74499 RepID=A0AAD6NFH5_DREDA|nr:hypothetical protein Dda_8813 [Drechslerella dactyloides]
MPCSAHPPPWDYDNPAHSPPLFVYVIRFESALRRDLGRAGREHILARPYFGRPYFPAPYGDPPRPRGQETRTKCQFFRITPMLVIFALPWILFYLVKGAVEAVKGWIVRGARAVSGWVRSWRRNTDISRIRIADC